MMSLLVYTKVEYDLGTVYFSLQKQMYVRSKEEILFLRLKLIRGAISFVICHRVKENRFMN